eukprot:470929-Amphidinium_carterae.1
MQHVRSLLTGGVPDDNYATREDVGGRCELLHALTTDMQQSTVTFQLLTNPAIGRSVLILREHDCMFVFTCAGKRCNQRRPN